MRIGGQLREGASVEVIRSPWNGEAAGEVAVGGPGDMDAAIEAAEQAFSTTRDLPSHRRAAVLEGTACRLREHADELATLMARESGKPIRYCRAEVARAVVTFTLGAEESRRLGGEVMPIDLEPRAEGMLCMYQRVPRGPVAAIAPFNFPLNLVAHKLSPATAAGCSVVLKPPPQCPLTAYRLAELMDEAGLPPGALNVLHCPPGVAQRMVEDPRMKLVSFTGSDAVGWRLKAIAGKKPVLLELGGNAPCILDEGIDVGAILDRLVQAAFASAGQVCIKVQRFIVHRAIYDQFLERFTDAARLLTHGDPLDEKTVVGPLIDRSHVARVLSWVREAVLAGARLHCGGEADGPVVLPTVLSEVPPGERVVCDEVFGPVAVVERAETFDAALVAANRTRFGLQAGVFTRDVDRALRAFRRLDYGGVMVNEVPTFRVDNFPYGGSKDSGLGREGVRFAVEEMTEPRVLVLRGS